MYTDLNKHRHVDLVDTVRRELAANAARRDTHTYYSDQVSPDTAEIATRVLIRSVPVVYGALLGGLIGDLWLGVALGVLLSVALDARMGDRSMLRPLFKGLLCPFASVLAARLRAVLTRLNLPVPGILRTPGC